MNSQLKIEKILFDSCQYDDMLESYFSEFDFSYTIDDKYIIVELSPCDYTYCEDIHPGLKALHISDANIKDFCYIDDHSSLCLSENWIPFIWCSVLKKINKKNSVKIIHVDDHADMMSPFIKYRDGKYYNMIDGSTVCLTNKESVKRTIESGAITIGSQITMITYTLDSFSIYHLKRNTNREFYSIKKELISDGVLSNATERISLSYTNDPSATNKYLKTDNPEDFIGHINTSDNFILHIDMDYFANRYNGSTSWKEDNISKDSILSIQKESMDRLCNALSILNKNNQLVYIIIGLSPSFYPSEYWKDGLQYLLNGLSKAGCKVDKMKERFFEEIN